MSNNPTPYTDINNILQAFQTSVQDVLGDHFVGMYLHGSLASGDFDPQRSDIDFLVVTDGDLSEEIFQKLKKMHERIATSDSKWVKRLEGSYVSRQVLQCTTPPKKPRPYINEGRFCLARYGYEWTLELHVLREKGIVLAGQDIKSLIDPVGSEDIRRAVLKILHEWWVPMLEGSSRLDSNEYQVYGVLTMCRILYALKHGDIVSKNVAVQWAKKTLDESLVTLIDRALRWEEGMEFDRLDEVRDFVRYVVECAKG